MSHFSNLLRVLHHNTESFRTVRPNTTPAAPATASVTWRRRRRTRRIFPQWSWMKHIMFGRCRLAQHDAVYYFIRSPTSRSLPYELPIHKRHNVMSILISNFLQLFIKFNSIHCSMIVLKLVIFLCVNNRLYWCSWWDFTRIVSKVRMLLLSVGQFLWNYFKTYRLVIVFSKAIRR